jgi:hypothetical protein
MKKTSEVLDDVFGTRLIQGLGHLAGLALRLRDVS